ncbi:hypothetical protein FISHEDRAFT_37291, partial [Fistulina hepatica ATCC 64428]
MQKQPATTPEVPNPVEAYNIGQTASESIPSRDEAPHDPRRIAQILGKVTIGDDLNDDERKQVMDLISEYADIFALSMKEVWTVPGAVHHIRIPESATFQTKVHQRPLTQAQREFLHKTVREMEAAGVISPIAAEDVKCVS